MRPYRLLIIGIAVLIAGCSTLRLGYMQADILLAWRANSYFDLDHEQRHEFSARLDRFLAWHRYEQLPEYAAFLSATVAKAERGLKPEDIGAFVDGFKSRYGIIANRGAADAAAILATLTPAQIVAAQRQFDKDNRKFSDERELDGNTDKRKRARLKRTVGQIEDWTGSLTREQERQVAALLDPLPLIENLRLQDRIRRQREFIELLNLRHAKSEFAGRLQQWLLAWDHGRTPEYARLSSEVFDQRMRFYLAVDKLLTPEQRQHALNRLQRFADDCKALSMRPPARAGNEGVATVILALF